MLIDVQQWDLRRCHDPECKEHHDENGRHDRWKVLRRSVGEFAKAMRKSAAPLAKYQLELIEAFNLRRFVLKGAVTSITLQTPVEAVPLRLVPGQVVDLWPEGVKPQDPGPMDPNNSEVIAAGEFMEKRYGIGWLDLFDSYWWARWERLVRLRRVWSKSKLARRSQLELTPDQE